MVMSGMLVTQNRIFSTIRSAIFVRKRIRGLSIRNNFDIGLPSQSSSADRILRIFRVNAEVPAPFFCCISKMVMFCPGMLAK